ncbi:MAG TPA: hypothetical protein VHE30_17975 [Polyangiaceae bacterium]|nr:hypothetical protein [Polyangiaceae bacterium]
MVGKVGLSSAAEYAVSGLRDASDRADRAAEDVATAGFAADTVTVSDAARAGAGADDVRGLVDLRMARYQFAAQVAVLRTVDEMSEDALSIVRRRG